MKKLLISVNYLAGIFTLAILMYVGLYGPVAVVPFERIIRACLESHSVASPDMAAKLSEAHMGYYHFLVIPISGLLLILLLVFLSIGLLTVWNERLSKEGS